MAIDNALSNVTPKKLRDIKVFITKYNEVVVEVTPMVNEISIYESIFSPFLYGEIIMIDSSAMLSTFPFIGQEKVRLEWEREGKKIQKDFYVTNVFDVVQINDTTGGYGISITSEKQMVNAISLFSKSYKGNSAEIITRIYKEYLKEDVDAKVLGKFNHNIVFPWIKPFAAINMIQRATPAEDDTPIFVFESLYGERPVLNSMKGMLTQKPVFKIDPKNMANNDTIGGLTSDNTDKYRGQVYSANISSAYNTLEHLSEGTFGAFVTSVDISTKTAEVSDFNYKISAPAISNDWISTFFRFDDVAVENLRNTKNFFVAKNTLAYDDFPNLNSVDDRVMMTMHSYMKRLKTTSVNIHMNSVILLEVGKTVHFEYGRFSPKLSKQEDVEDKVNSGTYLISAIRHYIKNNEYTMSLELIRDGMGEEAQLYASGSNPFLGLEYRDKVSVLKDFPKPPPIGESIFDRLFNRK